MPIVTMRPRHIGQLKQIPLFSELSKEELNLIADTARLKAYPKGSVVFYEGDTTTYMLLILAGEVKVALLGDEGQEIILDVRGPGSIIGEMALLDGAPRSATVITTQHAEFMEVPRGPLLDTISMHPSVGLKLLVYLCRRLREQTEQVRGLTLFDVYGRIIRCLLSRPYLRGQRQAGKVTVGNPPSNQALARMIGASRETVSRAMRVLHENQYLEIAPNQVTLTERAIRQYWPNP
jgi:CRP/FNR family cyclic AMP-dependent transcriptional regulator